MDSSSGKTMTTIGGDASACAPASREYASQNCSNWPATWKTRPGSPQLKMLKWGERASNHWRLTSGTSSAESGVAAQSPVASNTGKTPNNHRWLIGFDKIGGYFRD